MKLIIVYIKILKSFFMANVTASVVMFMSIALVFLSSMYFMNAFMSYKSTLSGYYRMRTIECKYNAEQSQLVFLDFPDRIISEGKNSIENIIFRYNDGEIQDRLEDSLLSAYEKEEIESNEPIDFTVVSYYDNKVNDERINAGQNIYNDSVDKSELVIIYNKSIYMELYKTDGYTINIPDAYSIGDAINIENNDFKIIGIINNFGYSMIPYTTGLKNLKLKSIDVNFNKNVTVDQTMLIAQFIKDEFKSLDVSTPPNIDQELLRKISFSLFLLSISCFMGVFYLLYIYKYIIENNKKTMIINRMLGLSMRRSIMMIIFQVFIINTSVYIIIALIYRYAIVNLFTLYIPDTVFFILIYLFVIVSSSLIIYPFAKKICGRIFAGGASKK